MRFARAHLFNLTALLMIVLCLVDGHVKMVSYSQINETKGAEPYNLDWTVGGLAGADLRN